VTACAADLLAAMPDPSAVDEHWRRICRDMVTLTAAAEYQRGQADGYLLAVADFKAFQHAFVKDAAVEHRRWHLCCPPCRQGGHQDGCPDCEDRERATFGQPMAGDAAPRGEAV